MLVSSIAHFNGLKKKSAIQAQSSKNSFNGTQQIAQQQTCGTILLNNIKSAINKLNILA